MKTELFFFHDCTTKDDAKKRYYFWAKKLHPDVGGDDFVFKAMEAEYRYVVEGKNPPRHIQVQAPKPQEENLIDNLFHNNIVDGMFQVVDVLHDIKNQLNKK